MRIAMFGGSFNPIHCGHTEIALAVRERYDIDRVLIMVAKDPPHKQIADGVSAAHRLKMTQAALEEMEEIEASDIELERPGKSYTVDTLRQLGEIYPGAELYCIVGTDMLLTLDTWHEAPEIFRLARIIAVGRPDAGDMQAAAKRMRKEYGANISISGIMGPDISSTMVREAVEKGESISGLVADSVADYIYCQGFYLGDKADAICRRLKDELGHRRYIHTMGVVRMAAELASRYGADGQKTQLAALLHDCAKLNMERQRELAAQYGMDFSSMQEQIAHGPIGAERARREFDIADDEVLSAIACHSTCKAGMGMLDKIVYLADKIEYGRSYEGVEYIRSEAEKSLDGGVIACIEHELEYLEKQGERVDPNTFLALEELKNKNREA